MHALYMDGIAASFWYFPTPPPPTHTPKPFSFLFVCPSSSPHCLKLLDNEQLIIPILFSMATGGSSNQPGQGGPGQHGINSQSTAGMIATLVE
jgi:hypothetical protein